MKHYEELAERYKSEPLSLILRGVDSLEKYNIFPTFTARFSKVCFSMMNVVNGWKFLTLSYPPFRVKATSSVYISKINMTRGKY